MLLGWRRPWAEWMQALPLDLAGLGVTSLCCPQLLVLPFRKLSFLPVTCPSWRPSHKGGCEEVREAPPLPPGKSS